MKRLVKIKKKKQLSKETENYNNKHFNKRTNIQIGDFMLEIQHNL